MSNDSSKKIRTTTVNVTSMLQQIYKIKVVILLSTSFIFFSISTGFSLGFKKGDIEIHHPYINETFSGATSAAGYLTIKNHSAE